jgi:hypothetical protein
MNEFFWDAARQRYREANGRFVSTARVNALRDQFLDERHAAVRSLTGGLFDAKTSLEDWQHAMLDELKALYIAEYALGRGGLKQMDAADWDMLSDLLAAQQDFLNAFANDVAFGTQTQAQAENRATLYVDSAIQAHERGKAVAYGLPELPAYPGDGATQCLTRCRCNWRIEPTETGWSCTWEVADDEGTCSGCHDRGAQWAPLLIERQGSAA